MQKGPQYINLIGGVYLWQGVKASEDAALQAAAAAQAAESGSNAVETTSKAALSALRCSQVIAQPLHDSWNFLPADFGSLFTSGKCLQDELSAFGDSLEVPLDDNACPEVHDGSAREPQNLTLRKKCSIAPVVTRVQAANAAAAAEGNAMGSANHARIEQSMASLAAAMAAMALFEQVTHCCTFFLFWTGDGGCQILNILESHAP
jgi:hypothetical protein